VRHTKTLFPFSTCGTKVLLIHCDEQDIRSLARCLCNAYK